MLVLHAPGSKPYTFCRLWLSAVVVVGRVKAPMPDPVLLQAPPWQVILTPQTLWHEAYACPASLSAAVVNCPLVQAEQRCWWAARAASSKAFSGKQPHMRSLPTGRLTRSAVVLLADGPLCGPPLVLQPRGEMQGALAAPLEHDGAADRQSSQVASPYAWHQKLKHKPCVGIQVYQSAAALLAGGPPERPARAPRRRGRRGDQVTQALDPQATMALGEWVFDSVWPSAGPGGPAPGGLRMSFGFTLAKHSPV